MKFINGECLEEMEKLISQNIQIDLILCDLPYGSTSCDWDSTILLPDLWDRYRRILKPNKPIVLFSSQPFTSVLINSNLPAFREEIVWLKNRSGSGFQAKQKHTKIHETICVFSFDGKYTFHPQKWLIEEKEFITQRKTFKDSEFMGNNIYSPIQKTRKRDTGERNPLSVISCRVPFTPQSRIKEYDVNVDLRYHPTQKPLRLCEYLIETFSSPGDLVLDNCMGSGTTGVACKNLKRDFIGIELDDNYFEIAKKRILNT